MWNAEIGRGSRRRLATLAALVVSAAGCYQYTPLATSASPGATVSLQISDAGRVALGPQVGEGISSMEGVVDSVSDTTYTLRMRSVTYVNGQTNRWTGERLVVDRRHVAISRERQFSRTRTAAVVAAGVGSLAAFIATRSLIGSGSESGKTGSGDPSNQ